MWLVILISFIYLLYAFQLMRFFTSWRAIEHSTIRGDLPVSVVIPFRNEAKNLKRLVKGLAQQKHPSFELVFVNDHSEDDGEEVLLEALKKQVVNFRLLQLKEEQGKKAALTLGISAARFPLIVTTDADCFMDKHWLASMTAPFLEYTVQMVSGPVQYIKDSLFARWQAIELQALIAIGAAGIQSNRPTMANGANLAFRKAAFEHVGGYTLTPDTPSGDDEFLLQKFSKRWPEGIRFNKNKEALVVTKAAASWKELKLQRIRCAGKWKKGGRASATRLAMLVATIQLAQMALYAGIFLLPSYWPWWLGLLFSRLLAEGLLIYRSSRDIGASQPFIGLFALSFIIYPFYTIYFGLLANFGSFNWKGRNYR